MDVRIDMAKTTREGAKKDDAGEYAQCHQRPRHVLQLWLYALHLPPGQVQEQAV